MNKIYIYLMVMIGGAFGAFFRVFLTEVFEMSFFHVPFATTIVNIIGCFAMGFFVGLLNRIPSFLPLTPLIATGFLGGFTTFSTFCLEYTELIRRGLYLQSTIYIGFNIVVSFIALYVGILVAQY